MTGPVPNSSSRFHLYYSSKQYYYSNTKYAELDVDDTSSYGPETTTIYTQPEGTYGFSVYDFTNRGNSTSNILSLSGAEVKVYRGNTLVATYNVPANLQGNVWTVFEMNGNAIKPINTISNSINW